MTGYGKAETTISTGKITVEIRTLNAKNAEVNVMIFLYWKMV